MNTPKSKAQLAEKPTISNRRNSTQERKLALLQEVDKLKRKLRQEENVHRALERAFNRPLGALPRLPPYLPPYTLKLLAEVAVLEEEVVRLEEQVAVYGQVLYQESIDLSSRTAENSPDSKEEFIVTRLKQGEVKPESSSPSIPRSSARRNLFLSTKSVSDPMENRNDKPQAWRKVDSSMEDIKGKENKAYLTSIKDKQSVKKTRISQTRKNLPKMKTEVEQAFEAGKK